MRVSPSPTKAAAVALVLGMVVTGCAAGAGETRSGLTLGYFPNITHAPALVGVENGIYDEALGDTGFSTQTFNAGPDVINALFSGDVDAAFVGPNPTINGWAQSGGEALRIVAGSTSGGAGLAVRPGIDDVDDLRGTTLASPQLGNTQDVALRWFVRGLGWEADTAGGGDISIIPQENPEAVSSFGAGEIDGAWLPEPHLSRLRVEYGAELLVDEADMWPQTDGRFVTTNLIVSARFLEEQPEAVRALLEAHVASVDWINDNPERARETATRHLAELTGSELNPEVAEAALDNLTFTADPVAASLRSGAEHAEAVGLLEPVDLNGIYALDPLNDVLAEAGHGPVAGLEGQGSA
ncbi:MAG: ABC transporter substrate-binding protein [Nocardiopsis sp. BM-2018]|nr:MAG: ABC transporter substrate-binding protein [Nocardiopsis sp. BM-2018]